jgi:hypothetical protein
VGRITDNGIRGITARLHPNERKGRERDMGKFFENDLFLKSMRLTLFILNMYAVFDLIASSFHLSDATGILPKGD